VKQSDPLTPAEIAVFGHDARRRPDGTVEERGIKWTGSSPEAIAATTREEWPPASAPATPAAPPQAEPRAVDPRLIHPWPERTQ
jgi:hypothetical protein